MNRMPHNGYTARIEFDERDNIMMLRVPPEVHGAALVAAQASGKSLNQWVADVFRQASAQHAA
ncbi:MAG TPA: toxin-antitoxin system HicB family antitoxin [bacterium]|nr:toxin-antitoxin system HicB family antitoxin [bacterium]